jgi:hypothetical protein
LFVSFNHYISLPSNFIITPSCKILQATEGRAKEGGISIWHPNCMLTGLSLLKHLVIKQL